jgi:hypothetical protein
VFPRPISGIVVTPLLFTLKRGKRCWRSGRHGVQFELGGPFRTGSGTLTAPMMAIRSAGEFVSEVQVLNARLPPGAADVQIEDSRAVGAAVVLPGIAAGGGDFWPTSQQLQSGESVVRPLMCSGMREE